MIGDRARRLLGLAAIAASGAAQLGCEPEFADARPEWRVFIGTDAPVPQLADRLLLEILDESGLACSGCRRELGVADPAQWPLSFSVVPPEDGGTTRVRARLYRTALLGNDGFSSDRLLDTIVELPPTAELVDVGFSLAMSCFARLADLGGSTCDPNSGALGPIPTLEPLDDPAALLRPGAWAPAARVECAAPAEPGMQCIPGGALLLGSPTHLPLTGALPIPEQLVQLSPFFLDIEEVTVGAMKALPPEIARPVAYDPVSAKWCTFDPTSPANDAMPANCVSLDIARAACAALGKRLPTEAEWEWAAGNGELESSFPWAAVVDDPCSHSVLANAPLSDAELESGCYEHGQPSGPRPGGNPLDLTRHGILNLGGNVVEWTSDVLRSYADPECWGPDATLRVNPICIGSGADEPPVIRGGSWSSLPVFAHGYERNANNSGNPSSDIGFRCAK